jgi:DNA-binding SARP family transcriptional activator
MTAVGGTAQLRVRLLGGLIVEGLDERDIGSRKGRTLLKVLATARGVPLTADRIADVLWGDEPPARPADQVGVLVSRLRAVFGAERLPRTDAGYALRLDWLDLDELETRVAEAERRHAAGQTAAARAAAEAALALVRGPLLPDEDGEWVDAERAVAEAMARRAQVVLAEAALDAGDHGAATAAAEAMLAADPYDEVTLRALMRAHAGAGRPASALAAYVQVKERLAEELGVSPSAATEALHDAIVLGDEQPPHPTTPARIELPGRDHELALLDAALAGDANALVLVVGEPGIGKTALVETAAANAEARGFAVVRGDADLLGRGRPETTTATVLADAAAGRAHLFASVLEALESAAAGKPVLLTFDDVHRADAAVVEWLDYAVRRGRRLTVFATSRSDTRLTPTLRIDLGPLDITAAAAIVGDARAAELHERSGGNPLFLIELDRSGDALPTGIREAVGARVDALAPHVAQTVRTAAVLGPELDLDLLAGIAGRSVASLLDDADDAAAAGFLREQGTTYAFSHDLVREALAAGLTAGRRAFVHREAARVLAARPAADPRTVAWHAKAGGDPALAAQALAAAAAEAVARYDHDEAERALTEAVTLADGPAVRLARARVRMARWDLVGAADDADVARRLDAGAAAYEVAGWVAYYRRDYDAAQRCADEGAERSTDDAVRASCLALAGRTRHARGELHEAEPRLVEAADCRVTEVRSLAQVWLAGLRAHQGDGARAHDLAERALLDPDRFAHPFGPFHGRFILALAAGLQGRAADVLSTASDLERRAVEAGEQGTRFVPIAMNLQAWPLRAAGRTSEAVDLLEHALALCDPDTPPVAEPRRIALLDLVDTLLDAGRVEDAAARLDRAASEIEDWHGTMAWRVRQRLDYVRARLHLLTGDAAGAHAPALAAADVASASGNRRHAALARCVGAEAAARAGFPVDLDAVDRDLASLERSAGLEAWIVTARVAAACGVDRWWHLAERRAGTFVDRAGPLADDARAHIGRTLTPPR